MNRGPLIDGIRATMFYGEAPDFSELGLATFGTATNRLSPFFLELVLRYRY